MAVTTDLIRGLRWTGIAHVDLRRGHDGRVVAFEINPRYWASLMASLREGVNFPVIACRLALGLPAPAPAPVFTALRVVSARGMLRQFFRRAAPVRSVSTIRYVLSDAPAFLSGRLFGRNGLAHEDSSLRAAFSPRRDG